MSDQKFPPGWDADLINQLIRYYKTLDEEDQVAEDAESLLRETLVQKMINVISPGALSAEDITKGLCYVDELCESIAEEENPVIREAFIRAIQNASLAAVENDNRIQAITEILITYIRERVTLTKVKQKLNITENVSKIIKLTENKIKGEKSSQIPAPPKYKSALHEGQVLDELTNRFVEKIMEVLRPDWLQKREKIESNLIELDRISDYISQTNVPQLRDAILRSINASIKTAADFEPEYQQLINLLTTYIRERVVLQIQNEPTFSNDALRIVIQSLIIPGDKTKEGTLVKGVSALWFEMMRLIRNDPDIIYHIDCWKWEEILAGAYKQDGWEIVTLTPKRGDKGIDVIAERTGLGQLRFLLLDQMKAYSPGHLVGPDEIREMKGVLLENPKASKGLITTTADFTPGALEEAEKQAPRLELRPRGKLISWLASVIVNED
jgi:restriction system protein